MEAKLNGSGSSGNGNGGGIGEPPGGTGGIEDDNGINPEDFILPVSGPAEPIRRPNPTFGPGSATFDAERSAENDGRATETSGPSASGTRPKSGPGSRGPRKTGTSDLTDGVEFFLGGIFGALSVMTQTPELAISEQEATAVSSALQNVGKHYVGVVDPVKAAWVKLAMTVGGIAGVHLVGFRIRRSREYAFAMAQRQRQAPHQARPPGPIGPISEAPVHVPAEAPMAPVAEDFETVPYVMPVQQGSGGESRQRLSDGSFSGVVPED